MFSTSTLVFPLEPTIFYLDIMKVAAIYVQPVHNSESFRSSWKSAEFHELLRFVCLIETLELRNIVVYIEPTRIRKSNQEGKCSQCEIKSGFLSFSSYKIKGYLNQSGGFIHSSDLFPKTLTATIPDHIFGFGMISRIIWSHSQLKPLDLILCVNSYKTNYGVLDLKCNKHFWIRFTVNKIYDLEQK